MMLLGGDLDWDLDAYQFEGFISETEMWQVSLVLANADKLPELFGRCCDPE